MVSGILTGALYGLVGLGVSLSWGYLRLINLAHFALAFLGAYLTYQLVGVAGWPPAAAALAIVPAFFVAGALVQLLFQRFAVGEFASLLVTFGMTVVVEAAIQWFWTADFRRLELGDVAASLRVGPLYVPRIEATMFVVALAMALGIWAWLRFTWTGKALRASTENPAIAAAFGIDYRRLAPLPS